MTTYPLYPRMSTRFLVADDSVRDWTGGPPFTDHNRGCPILSDATKGEKQSPRPARRLKTRIARLDNLGGDMARARCDAEQNVFRVRPLAVRRFRNVDALPNRCPSARTGVNEPRKRLQEASPISFAWNHKTDLDGRRSVVFEIAGRWRINFPSRQLERYVRIFQLAPSKRLLPSAPPRNYAYDKRQRDHCPSPSRKVLPSL